MSMKWLFSSTFLPHTGEPKDFQLEEGHPLDVFLAGDDAQAKARVSAFIESPMDTGQLPMARTLEHLALLSLDLVAHSVKNTNFSLGIILFGSARP